MNELQPISRRGLPQASGNTLDMIQVPPLEMGGSGPKRDYAGLLEYWQMIRRHKGAVVLTTFLGALAGFVMTLSDARIYQARTSLEIQGLNEEFLNMKSVNPVSDANSYYGSDIQTQVKILQSRALIDRVLAKVKEQPADVNLQPPDRLGLWRKTLGLNPPTDRAIWAQAIGTAAGTVRVRGSETNRIIEISCDSTNPKVAANFCNTLTAEYIDQNLESRWRTTEHTGEWLTTQLHDLQIKLEKQQEELQKYARATSLVITGEGDDKTDVNSARLADLQKELSLAQADRFAKQSKYEMASNSPGGALPDVLDDEALKDTQSQLAELKAKLAQLRISFTPAHAEVRKVQVQIDALEASLEGVRANVLTRIRKDFEAAQRREALLTKAYQDQAHLVSNQSEEVAHYSLLKRDVNATRTLYETLQQRVKEAGIASALRANNLRVVDSATVPGAPYKPDVMQRAMLGLMFGAVVGVAFSVMRERADRTLQDPGDVSYHLGVPELGVVPVGNVAEIMQKTPRLKSAEAIALHSRDGQESSKFKLELVSWTQKTSLLAESFRTTLTSILFSRKGGDRPRVLVLTSASPREGKTTIVSNIGIALAEINHRVLVIDADMRRPRLHNVFDTENHTGLSDLLMERAPLTRETIRGCFATHIPNLFLMPSGGARRNVTSLLHSERLPELLKILRANFDTIVIDTPPMVNIADARLIAQYSDGLIMVVRSGQTTRDAALLAKARFTEDGIPMLGTILNGWNPSTPGYSYYKYYYAGYYHYYGDGSGKGGGADDGGTSDPGPSDRPRRATPPWKPDFSFGPQLREDGASTESIS